MKKFDVLKAITDEEKFSDMVFGLIEVKKTSEALAELLKEEMSEKELRQINEAALEEGRQPLLPWVEKEER